MRHRELNCDEERCRAFCNYYSQSGGSFPVFVGSRYQHGAGLGDILRGIFRTIFPIIAPIVSKTASTFISNAASGFNEGKSFKDAAKDALAPTGEALISGAMDAFKNRQKGSGKRKRVYKPKKKPARKSKRGSSRNKIRRTSEFSNF